MPFQLDDYLRRAAIRFERETFTPDRERVLAQELYTILANIQVQQTGAPVTITPPGADGTDPIEIDDFDIPPFDLDFPDDGANQPTVTNQPGYTREETQFWHRAMFVGEVTGSRGGGFYDVTIYPDGFLESSSRFDTSVGGGDDDEPEPEPVPRTNDVTAELTDLSLAESFDVPVWVDVFWVAEYLWTVETFRDDSGNQTHVSPNLSVLQEQYLFNAPAAGGGGARIAKLSTDISGMDGATPGSGTAILQTFGGGSLSDAEPAPGSDEPPTVTVYSSVQDPILLSPSGADKYIQVKRISGEWFADVEDCRDAGSNGSS